MCRHKHLRAELFRVYIILIIKYCSPVVIDLFCLLVNFFLTFARFWWILKKLLILETKPFGSGQTIVPFLNGPSLEALYVVSYASIIGTIFIQDPIEFLILLFISETPILFLNSAGND